MWFSLTAFRSASKPRAAIAFIMIYALQPVAEIVPDEPGFAIVHGGILLKVSAGMASFVIVRGEWSMRHLGREAGFRQWFNCDLPSSPRSAAAELGDGGAEGGGGEYSSTAVPINPG